MILIRYGLQDYKHQLQRDLICVFPVFSQVTAQHQAATAPMSVNTMGKYKETTAFKRQNHLSHT